MSLHVNNQQPICQEARCREEVTTYNPLYNAGGACGFGCWGLQRVPLGAAHAATIEDSPVLQKEAFADANLPVPPGPHRGEWADVCGFSSRRTPKMTLALQRAGS